MSIEDQQELLNELKQAKEFLKKQYPVRRLETGRLIEDLLRYRTGEETLEIMIDLFFKVMDEAKSEDEMDNAIIAYAALIDIASVADAVKAIESNDSELLGNVGLDAEDELYLKIFSTIFMKFQPELLKNILRFGLSMYHAGLCV